MNTKVILCTFIIITQIAFAQSNELSYPYIAPAGRQELIKKNFEKIRIGFSIKDVCEILGNPDEIKPLYEPQKHNPEQIGYTHWYITQRLCNSGSSEDKKEKLVRISYGMDGRVIAVDHWGF